MIFASGLICTYNYVQAAEGTNAIKEGFKTNNILQNSTFKISSNGTIPDFWGACWHTNKGTEPKGNWFEHDDGSSPAKGANSIVLNREKLFLQSYIHWVKDIKGKTFTFSAYLKSEDEGDSAVLHIGNMWVKNRKQIKAELTKDWKRYSITATMENKNDGHHLSGAMMVAIIGGEKGKVYVSAPQLEEGSSCTEYRPSEFDMIAEKRFEFCKGNQTQKTNPPFVKPGIMTKSPVLDGTIDDKEWSEAVVSDGFYDSYTGVKNDVKTKVYIGGDKENLYLGFVCSEPEMETLSQVNDESKKKAWADDYIEIIIAPDPKSEIYSLSRVNPFSFSLRSENLYWYGFPHSVKLQKNSWHAEFQIPFKSGNVFSADGTININFFRGRVRDKVISNKSDAWLAMHDLSSWSPTYEAPKVFVNYGKIGGFSMSDIDNYAFFIRNPRWLMENEKSYFRCSFEYFGKSSKKMKIISDGISGNPDFILEPGKTREVKMDMVIPKNKWIKADIKNADGVSLFLERSLPVYELDDILSILTEYDYYSPGKDICVLVDAKPGSPLAGLLSIGGIGERGKTIGELKIPANGRIRHNMSIDGLGTGEYQLSLKASDTAGNEYFSRTVLRILPPGKNEVRTCRGNGVLFQNGRGIMPVGFFGGEALSDEVAREGFNTQMWFTVNLPEDPKACEKSVDEILRKLDALAEKKRFAIIKSNPAAKTYPVVADRIMSHTAVIANNYIDEPYNKKDDELKELYAEGKKLNPYLPLYINWGTGDWRLGVGGNGTLMASDIASTDFYPFCFWCAYFATGVIDVSRQLEYKKSDAHLYGRVMAFWNQFYGNDDAWRYPTGEELRAMTYLSLISGVRVFYYFAGTPASYELRLGLKNAAEELKALEPYLLNPASEEIDSGIVNYSVRYTLWKHPGGYILIACNPLNIPVKVSFDLKKYMPESSTEIEELFEKTTVNCSGGIISETFEALDINVYLINK